MDTSAPFVLDAPTLLLAERCPTPGMFRSPGAALAMLGGSMLLGMGLIQLVVWFPALLRAVAS